MESGINKKWLARISTLLRLGKIAAKFAAIGAAITGAVTAFTSSSTATGVAIGAAGATTYAATKKLSEGYEKTKHIAPGPVMRGSLAGRAIMEASMRKPAKTEAYVEAPIMKFETFMKAAPDKKPEPQNPFAWTDDGRQEAQKADEAQGTFSFLKPLPTMVVTTEEEDEVDATGMSIKKIRRTQLNFVAPKNAAGSEPDKTGRRLEDTASV